MTMAVKEAALWVVRAGEISQADELFLQGNRVAIGWHEVGDLSKLEANRDGFKSAVARTFPGRSTGSVANSAGQLFRFVHEIKQGDLILYPSKTDRLIHIGRVDGAYEYKPEVHSHYPNTRAVKWLQHVPRVRFSQGALYEIGSALTLFLVRTYADEFKAALDGKPDESESSQDETVAEISEQVSENARDFVLKRLSQHLKGHPFAEFVAHLLNKMGYQTRVSPEGTDRGVDIIAHKDELGFEPPIIKVQVKSTDAAVGDPAVAALYGKTGREEYGLVVSLSAFTHQGVVTKQMMQ